MIKGCVKNMKTVKNNNYTLPIVGDFISNRNLLKSINNCQSDAFISLTDDINGVRNLFFEDYSNWLVYGIQNSGKSNFIENIIINILLKSFPSDSKFVIIDTKRLEYGAFNDIPHLLVPIIYNCNKANIALEKIINEIDGRYEMLAKYGLKSIEKFNLTIDTCNNHNQKIPKLFIIIDDLLDLIVYSKNEIISQISLIIQKGRQVGVYIIVATSNVSRDIININLINLFSNRVCFRAYSARDSKLLLNISGAEKLNKYEYYLNTSLNIYDGKYKSYKISDKNVKDLINYVSKYRNFEYINYENNLSNNANEDSLYNEILDFVIETGMVSASLLQRRFRLGYSRSARIINLLEERGIIGPENGSKPRKLLIKTNSNLSHNVNNNEIEINTINENKVETNKVEEEIDKNSVIANFVFIIVVIIIFLSIIKYFLAFR